MDEAGGAEVANVQGVNIWMESPKGAFVAEGWGDRLLDWRADICWRDCGAKKRGEMGASRGYEVGVRCH